jgi:hypothetical protein
MTPPCSSALRTRIDAQQLPKRLLVAGFEEITPQQRDLLHSCHPHAVPIERVNSRLQPLQPCGRLRQE